MRRRHEDGRRRTAKARKNWTREVIEEVPVAVCDPLRVSYEALGLEAMIPVF